MSPQENQRKKPAAFCYRGHQKLPTQGMSPQPQGSPCNPSKMSIGISIQFWSPIQIPWKNDSKNVTASWVTCWFHPAGRTDQVLQAFSDGYPSFKVCKDLYWSIYTLGSIPTMGSIPYIGVRLEKMVYKISFNGKILMMGRQTQTIGLMTIPYHNMKTIGVQTPAHIIYRKHTWGVNRTNPLITHETITSSFKSEKAVLGLFPLDIRLMSSETGNIATFLHFFPFLVVPLLKDQFNSSWCDEITSYYVGVRRWFQTTKILDS